MSWYRTGTITATNGQASITGAGTEFVANVKVGEMLKVAGDDNYEIVGIASDTELLIEPAFGGASGAGQSYAVIPVRGFSLQAYTALRDAVTQWGGYLAGPLAGVFSEPITGTAIQQSVGDFTAGRLARAEFTYGPGNLLGTVSQSSGQPTGAVIERGSNANGEYIKFADGTMVASHTASVTSAAITTPSSGGYIDGVTVHSFPAAFASLPNVAVTARRDDGSWGTNIEIAGVQTVRVDTLFWAISARTQTMTVSYIAVGTWY